jgi:hypothetical protein
VHISLAAFAAGWGMKLTTGTPNPQQSAADPLAGLGDIPVVAIQRPRLGLPTGGADGR